MAKSRFYLMILMIGLLLLFGGCQLFRRQGPPKNRIPQSFTYMGDASTHQFHRQGCRMLKDCKVRIYYRDIAAPLKAGYTPCPVCKP